MSADDSVERLRSENQRLRERVRELEEGLRQRREHPLNGHETIWGLEAMLLFISPDSRVRYVNSNMERLLGYPRQTLLGRPLHVIDHLPFGAGLLELMRDQVLHSGIPIQQETSYYDSASRMMKHVVIRATPAEEGLQFVIEDLSPLKRLEAIFSRYVSPRVIERMLGSGKDYLKAEAAELTVLFSDLRGFTHASQHLAPEDVKALIDSHLEVALKVITEEDGTVDKIMGDGVMAFFGAPVPSQDHPVRALNAALRMQHAHTHVMREWDAAGLPALPLGIGLNTGRVVVGNIGSDVRMEYTVLGHEVNLGARLCQSAAGGDILMSHQTFLQVKTLLTGGLARLNFPVRFRGGTPLMVKGLDAPILTVVAQIIGTPAEG